MPTIELRGDGEDGNRVLARMYYPNDEAKCGALLQGFSELTNYVQVETLPAEESRPSRADARELLAMSEAGWRGTLAGETLVRLAAMLVFKFREPSVRKAIFSLRQRGIDLAALPDGSIATGREDKGLVLTEKSFWNYLKEFRAVFHFWAAHAVLESTEMPFYVMPVLLAHRDALNEFLGYAEWFLSFGCEHVSRNYHAGPLLERVDAWVVSPAVSALKPDLEAVAEVLTKQLKNYRVPRRL